MMYHGEELDLPILYWEIVINLFIIVKCFRETLHINVHTR